MFQFFVWQQFFWFGIKQFWFRLIVEFRQFFQQLQFVVKQQFFFKLKLVVKQQFFFELKLVVKFQR